MVRQSCGAIPSRCNTEGTASHTNMERALRCGESKAQEGVYSILLFLF